MRKKRRLRIIVTGGAGFLGSHLCERLLQAGNEVLCVDDLRTGSLANIAPFQDNSRFAFLRHDVCQPLNVEADEIYNLACPASPVHYQSDPIQTARTSVHGAFNLLELAERTGAKILQASTSEIYGDPHVHPQPESYWGHVNPVGPRACKPLPQDDPARRCPDITSAKRLLRWQPRVSLREGLQNTIACFARRIGDRALDHVMRAVSSGST